MKSAVERTRFLLNPAGEEGCKAPPPSALACGANRGKECMAGFTPFVAIPSIKKTDHLLGCHDCPG